MPWPKKDGTQLFFSATFSNETNRVRMKRSPLVLLCVFVLCLFFISCKKDQSPAPTTNDPDPLPTTIDTMYATKRFDVTAGNNQSVAYRNGKLYVGFGANAQGNKIETYDYATGTKQSELTGLKLGLCASMVYNKKDNLLYIANGGASTATHVYTMNLDAAAPTVQRDYNLESLGTAAVMALDEAGNRFFVIAAKTGGDKGDKTVTPVDIATGNIDAANQISIPYSTFPFIPQGAVYKDGKIYYLAGATSTVLAVIDLATKTIAKQLTIPQSAEPEGFTLNDDSPTLKFIMGYGSKGIYDLNVE